MTGFFLASLKPPRKAVETNAEPPNPGGEWIARDNYYVVELVDFEQISPPLSLGRFIEEFGEQIVAEKQAAAGEKNFPFVERTDGIRPDQAYLAKAPKGLLNLFAQALENMPPTISDASVDAPAKVDIWKAATGSEIKELSEILKDKSSAATSGADLAADWVRRHASLIEDRCMIHAAA